nr:MAG TPA: hypothetical protein [Inoviridae sp.]
MAQHPQSRRPGALLPAERREDFVSCLFPHSCGILLY